MPVSSREFALDVTQRLQDAGFQALWAGGCVRDQLLGNEPTDYDVATNATPDKIRELFGHRRTLALGAVFGVITVIGPRSAGNVEVATFRSDGPYSDGRHPDAVTFGTAEMDALRRDFTINGLFYDPVQDTVIDFVNGKQDLQQGIIRAIGDPEARIEEDKLRMLRAVRFAAALGFQLDPATLQTIAAHAGRIEVVSAERIAAEISRMLLNKNRQRAVCLLAESRLLTAAPLIPELQPVVDDASRMERMLTRLDGLGQPELPECMAALTVDVADPARLREICTRIRLTNEVRETAAWILQHAGELQQAELLPWSAIQPLLVDQRTNNALRFLESCNVADGQPQTAVEYCRQRLAWPADRLDPPRLVDGKTLKSLGVKPGPLYSELLNSVRQKQLDGDISTPQEAIELVKSATR